VLFEQVFVNLLENAARYSPAGSHFDITAREFAERSMGQHVISELHYLRVHMANLRCEIEQDSAKPQHILNEQGIGYRLATEYL